MPSSTPFPGHSGPLRPPSDDDPASGDEAVPTDASSATEGAAGVDDSPLWGDDARARRHAGPPWLGPVLERLAEVADRVGTSIPVLVGAVVAVGITAAAVVAIMGDDGPAPELTIPYAVADPVSADGSATSDGPPDAAEDSSGAATGSGVGEEGPPGEVMVHAAGAVTHPGLYVLDAGARVGDLLSAAGGPRSDADLDRVNLAAPLSDGSRVYVPAVGQEDPPPVVAGDIGPGTGGGNGPAGGATPDPGRLIDLNRADAAELETLPGVGPATAAAIIAHRDANGPFQRVEDLLAVRGIGDAKLAAIVDLVHT